jgi:hypothetical protein
LHHRRLSEDRLRDAVHSAIKKRAGAERIARAFAAAGGPSAAADAVEELLTAVPAPTASWSQPGSGTNPDPLPKPALIEPDLP